ncbi:sensor domain-containing diguanylate cyclase [Paenibacillus arenilitoris]|uniref:GGDEF domain-containing protein n=1 Tax=Paenibacillus arenilitoris TaxID=2772299 RepID=A0A927CP34_9BACL|nr:sensor domain-containing diguanylate cyclase [Paenibacillus arenilitoris]MBD2869366.1 GGDEF domain-containing protein [Paenibacillus arenilitoris]
MVKIEKGRTIGFFVIATVVLTIIITLLISAMVGYESNKSSLVRNTLELNRINAEKLAITANELLTSATDMLALSAAHLSGGGKEETSQFSLQLIRESNNLFNSVFIADKDGVVLRSAPDNIGVAGKRLESRAALEALEAKAPMISDPYIGITGRHIILLSEPIFGKSGDYEGFIAGSIYLSEPNLFEIMLGTQMSNDIGSYVYVVSGKGELLYHPDKERIGENVTANAAVRHVLKGEKGDMDLVNTKGVSMLAGYAPVAESGWGIISQTPSSSVITASRQLVLKMFTYSLPILLLVLLAVIMLTRYFSRPLYNLASFAEQLSSEANPDVNVPEIHKWNYEANELRKTIEKAVASMRSQIDSLSVEAQKDTLTGLNNRRSMDKVLAGWQASGTPFNYMILDIDHFKSVNDTYGHAMGDEVLRFLGSKLSGLAGSNDVCFRYGGEEFVVLSPGADAEAAVRLGERMRKGIAREIGPTGRPITVSVGIAACSDPNDSLEEVKRRADEALYRSKQAGRNRVSLG